MRGRMTWPATTGCSSSQTRYLAAGGIGNLIAAPAVQACLGQRQATVFLDPGDPGAARRDQWGPPVTPSARMTPAELAGAPRTAPGAAAVAAEVARAELGVLDRKTWLLARLVPSVRLGAGIRLEQAS